MNNSNSLDWRIVRVAGDHPKVGSAYREALSEALDHDPRELGLPFSVWSCADLARYMAEQAEGGFPLVSDETVRRHLHSMGYRVVRPVRTVTSPDPDYQAKAEQLVEQVEAARRGEVVLLFEDEVDLHLLPGIIGAWTKRGKQHKVRTPGLNQKRYGFGAVNVVSGSLTRRVGERKNSEGFCELVEAVVAQYCPVDPNKPDEVWSGRKVGLVIDNYKIHTSKKAQQTLDRYADRLFVVALPTYAPHLNVIERLWKHMRRRVTHNHLFGSITELVEAVEQFFCHMERHPSQVLSIIGSPG
jgi:hypothetical protein